MSGRTRHLAPRPGTGTIGPGSRHDRPPGVGRGARGHPRAPRGPRPIMLPSCTRAAAAILAALAAGGSAAAQEIGHSFTVAPLALRGQTGAASFSPNSYFMVLGIDGTV